MAAPDRFGNSPRDYVRALVCHYPRHIRETRLLLMLNAYFDDSRIDEKDGTPGVFTLAGYVGEARKWEAFADAWSEVLNGPPRPLEYLKTWQAYKTRDPESMFYGWSDQERDEKLMRLAKTANAHALVSVQTALRPAHYREIIGPFTEMRPYAFLFYSIASEMVKLQNRWGVKDKVDIYFDRQTDEGEEKLRAGFREFVADAPPELRERFGDDPVFKDDRCITPLQAADLFAWHFRRNIYETDRGNKDGLVSPAWTALLDLPRLTGIWSREKLSLMVQTKQKKIEANRKVTWMTFPDPSSGWGFPWKK